jgi:outer membrane biosynthesis protein TonB
MTPDVDVKHSIDFANNRRASTFDEALATTRFHHVVTGQLCWFSDCLCNALLPQTDAAAAWRKQVSIRLTDIRRFPPEALVACQSGTARVRFVMDRSGKLTSSELLKNCPAPWRACAGEETALCYPLPLGG